MCKIEILLIIIDHDQSPFGHCESDIIFFHRISHNDHNVLMYHACTVLILIIYGTAAA